MELFVLEMHLLLVFGKTLQKLILQVLGHGIHCTAKADANTGIKFWTARHLSYTAIYVKEAVYK